MEKRLIYNCPRCNTPNETTTCVIKYQSVEEISVWEALILDLCVWMKTDCDYRWCLNPGTPTVARWRAGNAFKYMCIWWYGDYIPMIVINRMGAFDGWSYISTLGNSSVIIYYMNREQKVWKMMGWRVNKKVWEVAWNQWDQCNITLHDTPLTGDLSGAVSLNRTI